MDLAALAGDPTAEPDDLAEAVDSAAGQPSAYSTVLGLADHDSAAVRTAVARALPHLAVLDANEPFLSFAVEKLISLSADPEPDVRNWACFGLGTQLDEEDGQWVREALVARLSDEHGEARREALLGLARRRDIRALPAVKRALAGADVWLLEVEAAGALGDSSLHDLVLKHAHGWDGTAGRTVSAALRLTDPDGLGDDMVAGLAAWYRDGADEETDPTWWHVTLEVLVLAEHRAPEIAEAVDRLLADDEDARHLLRSSALGQDAFEHGWAG
jgi:HEAT repeat protein